MNEKQKAWVYTQIDVPEDRYGSSKRQDQKLTEYASRTGWEVAGHSQDISSCRDISRFGLQVLIDAVPQGGVNILVVSGPDRLSRNTKDIIAYAEFLQNFGVEAYSPKQGKVEVLCTPVLKDSALAVPGDSPNLSIHQEAGHGIEERNERGLAQCGPEVLCTSVLKDSALAMSEYGLSLSIHQEVDPWDRRKEQMKSGTVQHGDC